MNEFLKLSETHPGNRCNCKLHIRDKRKYQNVCFAKKKKKKNSNLSSFSNSVCGLIFQCGDCTFLASQTFLQ